MTLRYQTAQSLTEYSLVIGLVVLACIGGIAILGTGVQQELGNAMGESPSNGATVAQIPNALSAPFTQQQGVFLTSQEIQSILDQSPTETIDLGNGKQMAIPRPNFTELQETLGPNGSTELALALIQRMQEALKSQGLDPETVIPEMGFFANKGHQMSEKQKQGEILLIKDISGDSINSYRQYSQGAVETYYRTQEAADGKLVFSQNDQGQYEVRNFIDGTTGLISNTPTPIDSFTLGDRIFFSGHMTQQTLANRPDLQGLQKPFSQILDVIKTSTNTLTHETSIRGSAYAGEFTNFPWLQTKRAANEACKMSNDSGCIQ